MLGHSTAMDGARNSSSLARPGCPEKCGNVSIPYPFGIAGSSNLCFLDDGFQVHCDDQEPYLATDKTLKVLGFNLSQGEIRIQKYIAESCGSDTDNNVPPVTFSLGRDHFTVSTKNRFTAMGCATVGMIRGVFLGATKKYEHYTSACGSFCNRDSTESSTECTGMGCCQISIPPNLRAMNFSFLKIDGIMNYSAVRSYNPCSYAFVAEAGWFNFSTSYVTIREFVSQYGTDGHGVPMLVDWAIVGNGNCVEAKKMNASSYACRAMNSECIDAPHGLGYRCVCSQGYDGNPYLDDGCQDIDECQLPYNYTCRGECINTNGSYNCSCPHGSQSEDPKKEPCTKIPILNQASPVPNRPELKFVIASERKGELLQAEWRPDIIPANLSQQVDTVTIFTIEDLKTATNNFDQSRELGTGGHGTVYKGVLRDDRVVAVKRSKIMNVVETEEFVQEIIILSQINHRNVVRLLGCCLEVEVPILVYEFIPNGTLFHLIHDTDGRPPMSLEARLKIAQESAEALAYLHLSTNSPIVHADVKSLNILLDENYMAKVTDFGASRMLPNDAVQFMTMVQGTLGYLDPEYLQERKLTQKSDVYSFGVVLLELITRKTAIYSEGLERGKCLASSFIQAMKENRVEGMLDTSIICVGMEELLREVAELSSQCLSIKGEERPSMTQVADKLKAIRSTWRKVLLMKHNETELLIQDSSEDAACGSLSPSMYWTAGMMGMDIETPVANNKSTYSMG
ncbi:hypothetical protein PR202_gb17936 [Eleusine coracana subsp. coracana]|uniref:Protein kinase domain-containing protein n=1 Tax=Eleusine coracana subsp. coracana TaxID=191504 RepID=A0AAV5F617_ELECO|nr:hypothetical protein PR202_gb17936 [Eleusine coracana subsp. coracana]